jgi:hypothetical protein
MNLLKLVKIQHIIRSRLKFKEEILQICKNLRVEEDLAHRYYLNTDVFDHILFSRIEIYDKLSKRKRWPKLQEIVF